LSRSHPRGLATGHEGFTLLEVLVAILLFALGALMLAQMQIFSLRGGAFGREAMIATTQAQAQMETLRDPILSPFAATVLGLPTSLAAGTQVACPAVPGMTLTYWRSDPPGGAAPERFVTITVQVTWKGQTLTFSTVVSEV
jgi:prepilin-type N-terminal cleavage/methylation domain-containing protein